MKDGVGVRGFFRLQIGEEKDGKQVVVGDSGWIENTICEDGFDNYIVGAVGAIAGSKQVSAAQLATQSTAVNSTQESLVGETRIRKTTDNSLVGNGTLRCTCQWSSTDNGAACDIGSIALYNTTSGGTMCCGKSFDSSTWNDNQNVSATYDLHFS